MRCARASSRPPIHKVSWTDNALAADIVFTTTQVPSSTVVAEWLYAVAVPFPTYADGVTSTLLAQFRDGQPGALAFIANNGKPPALFVTTDTLRALTGFFGRAPAARPSPSDSSRRTSWPKQSWPRARPPGPSCRSTASIPGSKC